MSIYDVFLPVAASLIKWTYLIAVVILLPVFLRSVLKKKKRYIFIMVACQIILVGFTFIYGNYRISTMIVTEEDADVMFDSLISEYKQHGQNGEYCFADESADNGKSVYIIREKNVFVPDYVDDKEMKFDCAYCVNENCHINKKYSNEFTTSSGLYVYISPVQTLKFPEDLQMSELLFSFVALWMPQGIQGTVYMEQDDYYVYIDYYDGNPYKSTIKYVLSPIFNFRSDKTYSLSSNLYI